MKRSSMRLILAAAAITLAGALGMGCMVTVRPAGVGTYYVSHRHVHDEWCGHYRTWYEGSWAYYYGGRWEYYNPGHRGWVYYDAGHVPGALHGHVHAAKVYRPAGKSYGAGKATPRDTSPGYGAGKAAPHDSGPSYGATKAAPRDSGPTKASPGAGPTKSPGYGATKAAPKKDKDKDGK